ncbi:MAG: NUDIX domain-containing protein [Lactimicrobium sp.]|uniref:NUDIX hydrolase n=1 Tax=Lactimicrobium sp. TaxID=2563780 RepID=UPI002F35CD60
MEKLCQSDHASDNVPSIEVALILMTVVQDSLKILLVRRNEEPCKGDWALPEGRVAMDEDMDDAVVRALRAQTHISKYAYFRQLYTLGNASRHGHDNRIMTTAYLSLTPQENLKKCSEEKNEQMAWFQINKKTVQLSDGGRTSVLTMSLEESGIVMRYEVKDKAMHNYVETRSRRMADSNASLAFDHIKVINMAMDQVQHRAASTGIMFNLLPKECTLRQMQTTYEAMIGKKTDTGNFRRDIRKMLTDTGRKTKVNGRMCELYTFNPMYTYLKENL